MTTGTLAIATTTLKLVSETFIKADITDLAPGRTVLLCTRFLEEAGLHIPTQELWRERAARSWGVRRATGLATYLRTGSLLELDRRQSAAAETFCREHDVRVMLAEYGAVGCRVASLCDRLGIPLFVYFRGHDVTKFLSRRLYRTEYRRLAAMGAGFVAVSAFLADRLVQAGFPADRVHVVPSGVKAEGFPVRAWPDGPPRLLAVGRLVEIKAPHLSIAAFARIADAFPDIVLDMIGDGELMERCRSRIDELGLQDRVLLHGAQPPGFVRACMERAHAFVQHSVTAADGNTEGLPVAVVEAMMSGLPVVSTRHAGIPEAVVHGETGLLVDEGDVDAMAAAIERLLRDDELAARMGAAGARRARARFSRANSVARLRRILGLGAPGLRLAADDDNVSCAPHRKPSDHVADPA